MEEETWSTHVVPGRLQFQIYPSGENSSTSFSVYCRNEPYVYKVRTNRPKRYRVTPAQGYICKGGSRNVKVSIPAPLASKLHDELNRSHQLHNRDILRVDMIPLTEKCSLEIQALSGTVQSEALEKIFQSGSKNTISHALAVDLKQQNQQEDAPKYAPESPLIQWPSPLSPVQDDVGSDDGMAITAIQNKYEELFQHTKTLTEERDQLNETLSKKKKKMQLEIASKLALEGKGLMWAELNPSSSSTGSPAKRSIIKERHTPLKYIVTIACLFLFGGYMWGARLTPLKLI